MQRITDKMRKRAEELIAEGKAARFLGWEKGSFWWQSPPVEIREASQTGRLNWDLFCTANLAKYLQQMQSAEGKTGVFVKGCDARGINRLLRDGAIDRDKTYLVGIPCPGMIDPDKVRSLVGDGEVTITQTEEGLSLQGPLGSRKVALDEVALDKCLTCRHPEPVGCDELLEGAAREPFTGDPYEEARELEELGSDERYDYWAKELSRCIRCYACRNVCPACNCIQCVFDMDRPNWLDGATNLSNNQVYQMIRFMHVAGRCIDCGECERACPMGIPLRKLAAKVDKDVNELFGPFEAGLDPEEKLPLGTFDPNDPDSFE